MSKLNVKVIKVEKLKGFVKFNFIQDGEVKTIDILNIVIKDMNVLLGLKKPTEILKKYIELEDVILSNINKHAM